MNEIMNAWKEKGMVIDVVDEKQKLMTRDQNWAFSERVVGNANKKWDSS